MTWYDPIADVFRVIAPPITDALKTGFPGFAGSSVFAFLSKPKSKWQAVAIIVSGLSISQIFTRPVVDHFELTTFVGPIGFIIGFSGMVGAQIGLLILDAAKELTPNLAKGWFNRKLNGTTGDNSNGPL